MCRLAISAILLVLTSSAFAGELPEATAGVVRVNLFGPFENNAAFPEDLGETLVSWEQSAMGFVRIPHHYDDSGVRIDWGTGVMIRAVTEIELEPGTYDFLGRSRSFSRLFIDGKVFMDFPKQKRHNGENNKVDPLPELPRKGMRMRPPAMDDVEKVVEFTSAGGKHTVVFDMMVGGPKLRLDFGEPCIAIAKKDEIFRMIGPQQSGPELTDEGRFAFVLETSEVLDKVDREQRQAADQQAGHWEERHEFVRKNLAQSNSSKSIDQLIQTRFEVAIKASGDKDSFFNSKVRPIFSENCYRCHGEKEKGGLNLQNRENILAGGDSELPAVVPGNTHESFLLEAVGPNAGDDRMPPKGESLSEEQIRTLTKWVESGAEMDKPPLTTEGVTKLIDDLTFLRRIWLDLVGVSPPLDIVREFQADAATDKRSRMISTLLEDDRWADNWMGYWQDVLAENPNLLKPMLNNSGPFRFWILEALRDNKPMDRFATELIMMGGSEWGGGPAGFGIATQNDVPMAAKAHIIGTAFLGVEMKCARCHDSPYHETSQQDLFALAAMLAREPITVPQSSSVPRGFFEHLKNGGRKPLIEVTLTVDSNVDPAWPFEILDSTPVSASLMKSPDDTREQFATKVTTSRRFAEVMVNRVWQRYMGAGIVEPVNDWEGNAPCDPALLAFLTDEFVAGGYDLKELTQMIVSSQTYQREAISIADTDSAQRFFEGPYRRRMTAEQIVDNAWEVSGRTMDVGVLSLDMEGRLPPGAFMNFGEPRHAWEFTSPANERDRPSLALPRIQAVVDVLRAFGWRDSRQEPTSHREEEANPLQPGVLANGVMGGWLTQLTDDSEVTQLCLNAESPDELTETLFMRFLTRVPTSEEKAEFRALFSEGFENRVVPTSEIPPKPDVVRYPHVSWSNHFDGEANSIKQRQELAARNGDSPTRFLRAPWRETAEDALWALLNSPEMILIP